MVGSIGMFAQPSFDVLPVSNDTTYQVEITVENTDNSESITLTEPSDSTGVRNFIDIQLARNSRQLAKQHNKLTDLEKERKRLKILFNDWNINPYFAETQGKYKADFYGTWRLWFDGAGSLVTIKMNRKIDEFGGDNNGTLVIESKEVIRIKDYFDVGVEVLLYQEKENIYIGEYLDKKISIRKVDDEIKQESE